MMVVVSVQADIRTTGSMIQGDARSFETCLKQLADLWQEPGTCTRRSNSALHSMLHICTQGRVRQVVCASANQEAVPVHVPGQRQWAASCS